MIYLQAEAVMDENESSLFDNREKGALFSVDFRFRYRLWRVLDDNPEVRTMGFVMLNPSTADAMKDDPTIRRCIHFAKREGCNRLEVVNLFAYRTPHPNNLVDALHAGIDIEGDDNLQNVAYVMDAAELVVVAWGANVARLPDSKAAHLIAYNRRPLQDIWCLGLTKDGFPKHPMARGRSRIADDQPLVRWP